MPPSTPPTRGADAAELVRRRNVKNLPTPADPIWAAEEEAQANLVRDIRGNPFRPVAFDGAWRTPTVLQLAQSAYEERRLPRGLLDPARLAVLADALEEGGCTAAELLAHLRSGGEHVRGCWALDAVLGRG